ncbi:hypothetical protein [Streptomyces sp. NPDC050416]|uniref:hypothetical protein n=1 Tax=Streptomyces sp. NPDC050416 TaxID=3365611 RepID=UPI0037AA1216
MCFTPKVDPGDTSGVDVVCPTAEHPGEAVGTPASRRAQPRDILTVEIAGLAGACTW